MRRLLTYVESGTGVAPDLTTFAWVFDDEFWGRCGQGPDEAAALAELSSELTAAGAGQIRFEIVERIAGDELAFDRDRRPATEHQRELTLGILEAVRAQSIALIAGATSVELDYDDPERTLPAWASWRTLRQMAWHLANTESRYYLPETGLGHRHAEPDLLDELAASGAHVRAIVAEMPLDRVNADGTWTSAKLLRRLAWHERAELVTMRRMADTARERAGRG